MRKRRSASSSSIASLPASSSVSPTAVVSPSASVVVTSSESACDGGGQRRRRELARRDHEPNLNLARAPALAHHEVAQRALAAAAVVRAQALGARPRQHLLARRVAALGGEQAVVERHDLVPPAGRVEAADQAAVGVGPERVLELVAVAPLLHRRHDRLQREAVEPADAAQRVVDLLGLDRELAFVGQHLPGRARMVGGGRDALGRGLEQLDDAGVAVGALGLEHARPHAVAGDRALDEDDVAVGARDAGAPEGEGVDGQLELVAGAGTGASRLLGGRGHRPPRVGVLSACTPRGRRRTCPTGPDRAGCRPSRGPCPGRRTGPAGAAARGAASHR